MADKLSKTGMKDVVAAETRLSRVDGMAGELTIAGFSLDEFAEKATFEETVYLLWHDALPTPHQLSEFTDALTSRRPLSTATLDLLRAASKQHIPTIDALRMGASTLSLGQAESTDSSRDDALRLVSALPTIAAAYWRLKGGNAPVDPDPDLGHAANYLYMLTGEPPGHQRSRAMETYLNTIVDHGLNASTFTARVITSTRSDMISSITGALGALKGPLHGGAPGPALDMVLEIGKKENIEPYLRAKLERGERLMGFGHAVYKVRDPRADVLAEAARRFYESGGDRDLYELAMEVERKAVELLEAYKPGRNLQTNVEFYTALLLHGLELPTELFTPTFALGRVAGWTAHCFEQKALDQIIRPKSVYRGANDRKWVPADERC
jgi:citrate synthase